MLSVHYGQELQVRPSKDARQKLAGIAIERDGIDVVIGHHAHVPAGVQRIGGPTGILWPRQPATSWHAEHE